MKYLMSAFLATAMLCSCNEHNPNDGYTDPAGADTVSRETPYNVPGATDNATPDHQ